MEGLAGLFAGLAGTVAFVAAFSGQNGDPDEEKGGLVVAVVAVGFTMAGLVLAARAMRLRRTGGPSTMVCSLSPCSGRCSQLS